MRTQVTGAAVIASLRCPSGAIPVFQGGQAHAKGLLLLHGATWRSGYATVCKTVYPGSIPGVASTIQMHGRIEI